MGFDWKRRFLGHSPLTVVELIISLVTVVGGLYLLALLPLVLESIAALQLSAVMAVIASPVAILVLIFWILGFAILDIIGIAKQNYRMRYYGLFGMILSRIYGLIASILYNGIFPITWLPNLTIILIMVVCYFVVRGRMKWGNE